MEKNKIFGLLALTIFLTVITSVFAMGAVTVTFDGNRSINSGTSLKGLIAVNITISGSQNNVTNCSLWAKSVALTANTTYTQIANKSGSLWISNDTTGDTNFTTMIWNSAMFEDGSDYSFKAICSNSTDGTVLMNLSSAEKTGVIIDNTAPTTPSALLPATDTIDTDGTVNLSCTVGASSTTSCTITFGSDTYTAGYSGTSCSKQITSIPAQTYDWYCKASDESNTTRTSVNRLSVKLPSSTDDVVILASKTNPATGEKYLSVDVGDDKTVFGMPIWFAVLLGIVAVVIVVIAVKKK